MLRIFSTIYFTVAFAFCTQSVLGEEPATLRYTHLLRILSLGKPEILNKDAVPLCFEAKSKLDGVTASEIQIELKTPSGSYPLELDASGAFVLPYLSDAEQADAWLIANQPKGSLITSIKATYKTGAITPVNKDGDWMIPYDQLFAINAYAHRVQVLAEHIAKEHNTTNTFPKIASATISNPDPLATAFLMFNGNRIELDSLGATEFVVPYIADYMNTECKLFISPPSDWSYNLIKKHDTATGVQ